MSIILLAASLAGCASIDFDHPRVESTAPADTGDTYLGLRYAALTESMPNTSSGFYPLLDGIDALSVRLLLAGKAERTIDTQYYLIRSDATSVAFITALLDAADRGVRVRLLLDDLYAAGHDTNMAALNAHPNFEVRVFNPFNRGLAGPAWSAVSNFSRINRRMHTKSFTVDNQVTIVGGRNIADEYFGAHCKEKFGDLDVVAIGSVVNDVSKLFDSFWNHETAFPLPAFANMPDDPAAELEQLRSYVEESRERVKDSAYSRAVTEKASGFLEGADSLFDWAPYRLVYDSPDKGKKSRSGPAMSIGMPLADAIQAAEEQLIVISPYFVPRKTGIEFFSELTARGVEVIVVTNSLAANNHSAVHGGYAPSRKPLLKNGVRLYEVRPDAEVAGAEVFAASGAKATLHTKAFIVDREQLFIGSFNFDPRSVKLNTELGVLIRSERLGRVFGDYVDVRLSAQTWEVFLDEAGRVRWRGFDEGREVVYSKEPRATWGQRFAAGLMRLLPVRGQL